MQKEIRRISCDITLLCMWYLYICSFFTSRSPHAFCRFALSRLSLVTSGVGIEEYLMHFKLHFEDFTCDTFIHMQFRSPDLVARLLLQKTFIPKTGLANLYFIVSVSVSEKATIWWSCKNRVIKIVLAQHIKNRKLIFTNFASLHSRILSILKLFAVTNKKMFSLFLLLIRIRR